MARNLHLWFAIADGPFIWHLGKGEHVKGKMVIAVGAAAIVAAGIAGCSSHKSTTSGTASSSQGPSTSASASSGASNAKVAIGAQSSGMGAVLSDADPPAVKSVGLGHVNGVTLGYTASTGQGNAQATKNGNRYKITGTATGVDMANPTQPVNKPFEIDVSCQ